MGFNWLEKYEGIEMLRPDWESSFVVRGASFFVVTRRQDEAIS